MIALTPLVDNYNLQQYMNMENLAISSILQNLTALDLQAFNLN